jgi:carbon-monoxide dehydrogenase large subunit
MAVIPKFVGERIKRREDPRLITGAGTYVDDLRLPGMLTAAILEAMFGVAAERRSLEEIAAPLSSL